MAPEPQKINRRFVVLTICGLLLLAVAVVFGQTVRHGFINYDDNTYVSENQPVLGGLTARGIAWACTTTHGANWHPITWLSHMLDCQLYGPHAGRHHLTNLVLHALNGILLFIVLWRMTGVLWPAALVAALFAIHPLRVQSVAWVAERKDLLSGLFFLLTLAAYVAYARRPFSLVRYLSVVVLFALGLLAKPTLVTLPFLLLLLDYWPLGRMDRLSASAAKTRLACPRPLLVEKVPLFGLTAISCVVTCLVQREALVGLKAVALPERLGNALVSYVAYGAQLFCPVGLAVFYPHRVNRLPPEQILSALTVLAVVSAVAIVWCRRRPYLFVGWFWYLGMLVPMIGLVQAGAMARADRYTYLSQIGLCIAVVWMAAEATAAWPRRRWMCSVASLLVLAGLMVGAWRQASYWVDSETLWKHTLACTSDNYLAHNNLGTALASERRLDEAIDNFRRALEIDPFYAMAHNNLGIALRRQGKKAEALAHFYQAVEADPNHADAQDNLGLAWQAQGRTDEAIAQFRRAAEIEPDTARYHGHLGDALAGSGHPGEAIAQYQRALEITPEDETVRFGLAVALHQQGRIDEALAQFREVLRAKPDDADARFNLATILANRGQVPEAIAEYEKALAARPDYPQLHHFLGIVLQRAGRNDDALREYEAAVKATPNDAAVRYNLGMLLGQRRQQSAAIEQWREAVRSSPKYVAALNQLAWALATSPNKSIRNGSEAVGLAQRAAGLSGDSDPVILDTLAAAYAESQQFEKAAKMADRAAALAGEHGDRTLADMVRVRAKLYRAGKPYHENSDQRHP
jgi:protein O-mannosyl-transferase